MASNDEDLCTSHADFAVICSFVDKFGEKLGFTLPNIGELQAFLEDTDNVSPLLIQSVVLLLRRINRSVKLDRWEKTLQRFAHLHSHQDGWELERFGFKKAKLEVKIRVLKNLFEAQFDNYKAFKDKVNLLGATELRLQPCGRDKKGVSYWCQLDDCANLRIYSDDQDEETWTLVASTREELVALIAELESETPPAASREMSIDGSRSGTETPMGLSEAPTPVDSKTATPVASGRTSPVNIDTGQTKESGKVEEKIKNEVDVEKIKERLKAEESEERTKDNESSNKAAAKAKEEKDVKHPREIMEKKKEGLKDSSKGEVDKEEIKVQAPEVKTETKVEPPATIKGKELESQQETQLEEQKEDMKHKEENDKPEEKPLPLNKDTVMRERDKKPPEQTNKAEGKRKETVWDKLSKQSEERAGNLESNKAAKAVDKIALGKQNVLDSKLKSSHKDIGAKSMEVVDDEKKADTKVSDLGLTPKKEKVSLKVDPSEESVAEKTLKSSIPSSIGNVSITPVQPAKDAEKVLKKLPSSISVTPAQPITGPLSPTSKAGPLSQTAKAGPLSPTAKAGPLSPTTTPKTGPLSPASKVEGLTVTPVPVQIAISHGKSGPLSPSTGPPSKEGPQSKTGQVLSSSDKDGAARKDVSAIKESSSSIATPSSVQAKISTASLSSGKDSVPHVESLAKTQQSCSADLQNQTVEDVILPFPPVPTKGTSLSTPKDGPSVTSHSGMKRLPSRVKASVPEAIPNSNARAPPLDRIPHPLPTEMSPPPFPAAPGVFPSVPELTPKDVPRTPVIPTRKDQPVKYFQSPTKLPPNNSCIPTPCMDGPAAHKDPPFGENTPSHPVNSSTSSKPFPQVASSMSKVSPSDKPISSSTTSNVGKSSSSVTSPTKIIRDPIKMNVPSQISSTPKAASASEPPQKRARVEEAKLESPKESPKVAEGGSGRVLNLLKRSHIPVSSPKDSDGPQEAKIMRKETITSPVKTNESKQKTDDSAGKQERGSSGTSTTINLAEKGSVAPIKINFDKADATTKETQKTEIKPSIPGRRPSGEPVRKLLRPHHFDRATPPAKPVEKQVTNPSTDKATGEAATKEPDVGEAIEEPVMIVKGDGEGAKCESGNDLLYLDTKCGRPSSKPWWECFDSTSISHNVVTDEDNCETIEEHVMYFWGEGNGLDCDAGNNGDEKETKTETKQGNGDSNKGNTASGDVKTQKEKDSSKLDSDVKEVDGLTESEEAKVNGLRTLEPDKSINQLEKTESKSEGKRSGVNGKKSKEDNDVCSEKTTRASRRGKLDENKAKETTVEKESGGDAVNNKSESNVKKGDSSKEKDKKEDSSKEKDKKEDSSKQNDKKGDSSKEKDKKEDSSKEKDKKEDSSKEKDKKEDSSKEKDKKEDSSKEKDKKEDASKEKDKKEDSSKEKDNSTVELDKPENKKSDKSENKKTGQPEETKKSSKETSAKRGTRNRASLEEVKDVTEEESEEEEEKEPEPEEDPLKEDEPAKKRQRGRPKGSTRGRKGRSAVARVTKKEESEKEDENTEQEEVVDEGDDGVDNEEEDNDNQEGSKKRKKRGTGSTARPLPDVPRARSARIAKIREKEEDERRQLEAIRMKQLAEENRLKELKRKAREERRALRELKKGKKDKKDKKDKDKKKKKKKKRAKRRKRAGDPWENSSSSSSSSSEEEIEEEEEDDNLEFKSDHEFSPESDIEEADAQPVKRARTAKKVVSKSELEDEAEEEEQEEESEEDQTQCMKCGHDDHPETILLCDNCDEGWHLSCLRPPLLSVPEGDWICPTCEHVVLVKKLKEVLEKYDECQKKAQNEEIRKQRLAYVNVSLDNILPDGKKKKKKHREGGEGEGDDSGSDSDSEDSDSESDDSSGSSSDSSSESEAPLYTLRARCSRTLKEQVEDFDEMINEAIRDEMEAAAGAGNAGRGKDIDNIISANNEDELDNDEDFKAEDGEVDNKENEKPPRVSRGKVMTDEEEDEAEEKKDNEEAKEEKKEDVDEVKREREADEDDEEVAPKRKKRKASGSGSENDEDYKASDDHGSESEEEEVKKPVRKRNKPYNMYSKKRRRLTDLDAEDDDDASDEDFMNTSEDEDEESDESFISSSSMATELDSDDSDVIGSKKKRNSKYADLPLRRSTRNRSRLPYEEDSDDYGSLKRGKKKKKRRRSSSEDEESSDSERSFRVRKKIPKKKPPRGRGRRGGAKKGGKKGRGKKATKAKAKTKKTAASDDKPAKPRIKYSKPPKSKEDQEEEATPQKRVTRGRQVSYYDALLMTDDSEESEPKKWRGKVMKGERVPTESSEYEASEDEMRKKRGFSSGQGRGKVMKGEESDEDEEEYESRIRPGRAKKDDDELIGKPSPPRPSTIRPNPVVQVTTTSSTPATSTPATVKQTTPVTSTVPQVKQPATSIIPLHGPRLKSTEITAPVPTISITKKSAPAPSLSHTTKVAAPLQGKATNITVPVQGKTTNITVPVQGKASNVTVPVQGKTTNITVPVQGKTTSASVPVSAPPTSFVPAAASPVHRTTEADVSPSRPAPASAPASKVHSTSMTSAPNMGGNSPGRQQSLGKWGAPHLPGVTITNVSVSNAPAPGTPPRSNIGSAPGSGTPPRPSLSGPPVTASPPPPYRSSPLPMTPVGRGATPTSSAPSNMPPGAPPNTSSPHSYPPYRPPPPEHYPQHPGKERFPSHPAFPEYAPPGRHSPSPHGVPPRHPSHIASGHSLPHMPAGYGPPGPGSYPPGSVPPPHPGVLRGPPHDLYRAPPPHNTHPGHGSPSHPGHPHIVMKPGYPGLEPLPYAGSPGPSPGPIGMHQGSQDSPAQQSPNEDSKDGSLPPSKGPGEFSSGLMSYFSSQRDDDVE